ncbi:NADP-dependent oxidoreductase [Sphingobium sp. TA15]|uniref:Putative 2-alkenal reductase n=1 Tax=Sphingobium indicum (strain DSM 16413 / CCM 7287 / MTCC 6362 / UT26 / NBRC 101211 / UT26S) TaxID=452662 RepID=D4Z275_SPHIU|nr:NADP-dependent oxidoreductase [Sphingobium indicum]BAI96707.1 putative 2-alkenal reductase [Sphingobium indicum UT26S]BDD66142.1 NADP-dependent oxidoreductase [Sphingobium sp. TA15]
MSQAWYLVSRPAGMPTMENFALRDVPASPLAAGEVRIANRWVSVDPYMRGRMNEGKSYVPPYALDAPMEGGAVGEVIESASSDFVPGDKVLHMGGWRDEAVLPATEVEKLPADLGVSDTAWLGMLGLPGFTAWFGLLSIASAKPGDIVFVSAAAGAVGSAVVQIAKAKGMTVIGSAGGPEKCAWVREIGADAVIDYKEEGSLVRKLRTVAPNGIDVYYDNVGGDHLDAAIALSNDHARFAICGMTSIYNGGGATQLRYAPKIIGSRIRIEGFIYSDFEARRPEFLQGMTELLKSGKITTRETIHEGLAAMPDAFIGLFSGGNTGKMLVKI